MANFETVSIEDYTFQLYDFSDSLHLGAGVYVVLKRGFGVAKPSLIYVGETINLHNRFLNHEKQPCFDTYGANKIRFLSERDINNRLRIEKKICVANNPICNDGC